MKVMVIDTVGTQFPDYFKSYFPNVKIRGYDLTDQIVTHPHGYQAGYYATILLNLMPGEHEAVYVRIFDGNGVPIPKSNEWMLDVIADEMPDVITNSWGQWDGDNRLNDALANYSWANWAVKYNQIISAYRCASFFAAGNNDQNDSDSDIDYPGKLVYPLSACIGSHRRNGIPSEFSGDGKQVVASFWAEHVQLLSGDKWERGSGTSFACPKAAGLAAYLKMDTLAFAHYAEDNGSKPDYFHGDLPNAKWGWGSLEHKYQEKLSMLSENLRPPRMSHIPANSGSWLDFTKVI